MKIIHAWLLAPSYKKEDHHLFRCKTKFGLFTKLLYAKIFWDYIEIKEDTDWMWGVLPSKSGNYEVRYKNNISRDDFTTEGNHWWNVGTLKEPWLVEWRPGSYRPL